MWSWRWLRRVAISSPAQNRLPEASTWRPRVSRGAGLDAALLGGVVESGDGLVGGGGEHDGLAAFAGGPPCVEGVAFHSGSGAAAESSFEVIDVGNGGVAPAEAEGRVRRSQSLAKRWDLVELDGAVGVDEMVEHATSADGGELHRVTDESEAPASVVGEGRRGCRGGRWGTMPASSTMTVEPAGRS